MPKISVTQNGDFTNTINFLKNNKENQYRSTLEYYGKMGVDLLKQSTPVDTGLTSDSWYYEIEENGTQSKLQFCNSNVNKGVPIAIILQYGHATKSGSWIQGRDYINPAIQPIFDEMTNKLWKGVTGK